jgi:hypothetical protein
MSTGLDASIVTPGRTAPEVSRTTPAIDDWTAPCAEADVHQMPNPQRTTRARDSNRVMIFMRSSRVLSLPAVSNRANVESGKNERSLVDLPAGAITGSGNAAQPTSVRSATCEQESSLQKLVIYGGRVKP